MQSVPVSEHVADDSGIDVAKFVVAHRAPQSVVADLQTTFAPRLPSGKTDLCKVSK